MLVNTCVGELKERILYAAISQPYFLTGSIRTQTALCSVSTWIGHHTEKIHFLHQQT